MATNEELQAQIDVLREALGAVGGLEVDSEAQVSRIKGRDQLKVWIRSGSPFKKALERFDELRGG